MNIYAETLKQALYLFPILVLGLTIPYIAYNYNKYGSVFSLRILIIYSFLLYMLCITCLVILPLPGAEAAALLQGHEMQLTPFSFVKDISAFVRIDPKNPRSYLTIVNNRAFLTNIFNLFMTMPFGMYLRYYFKKGWKQTVILSFLLSLFFEIMQLTGLFFIYPGSYRLFDVDDLIVNTTGGLLGFFLIGPFLKVLPTRKELDELSYRRGVSVSFLRRLASFGFDVFFLGFFAGILSFFFIATEREPDANFLYALVFFWFLLLPVLLKGRSLGKRITSTKIVHRSGAPAKWYHILLRSFSFSLIFFLPGGFAFLLLFLRETYMLTEQALLVLAGVGIGMLLFYLLYASLMMTLHKPLFYEKLSKTEIVSTVKPKKELPN